MPRPDLSPCLICEKQITYLWDAGLELETGEKPTNLNDASDVTIQAWYGSNFDTNEYHANICDECLDKAIQKGTVLFIKEHSPFG